jgi:hypothetical protein
VQVAAVVAAQGLTIPMVALAAFTAVVVLAVHLIVA